MLKLFKSHLAFIPVLIIIVFMMALRIDVLFGAYIPNLWQDELAPFSLLLKKTLGLKLLTNHFFNLLLTAVIVFFQAGIIMSIFELYKNTELKSFLPVWIFVLIMHLHPDLIFLSPQLISVTFILLAFRKLIVFVESNNKKKAIFDIALFIGVASMFWVPSFIFLLFVFYFLYNKSKLNLRAFLAIFFTVLIPLFYVLAFYILSDQWQLADTIFNSFKLNNFHFNFYPLSKMPSSILVGVLSLSSIYFVSNFVSNQLIEIKAFFGVIAIFIFNVFLVYLFQNDNHISLVIFLLFPIAIFLSILFNRIKRNIVAEFIHLVLLLTIIINFMNFT